MTDYDLGYEHGFNDHKPRSGVKKYPNNTNYMAGFNDGDNSRVYMHRYIAPNYLGSNDTTPD